MRHLIAFLLAALVSVTAQAAEWKWLSDFTEASSTEYAALLEELHAPGLTSELGVPVSDLHWQEEGIDVHLKSGAIFLETNVQGVPVGAFFEGEATVTVVFDERIARDKMKRMLSMEALEEVPIKFAYFNTLRGSTLLKQLGLDAKPSVQLASAETYHEIKSSQDVWPLWRHR